MNNKLSLYYGYSKNEKNNFYYTENNDFETIDSSFSLSPLLPYKYDKVKGEKLSLGEASSDNMRTAMQNFYKKYYSYHTKKIKKDIAGSVKKYNTFQENLEEIMNNFHKEFRNSSYKMNNINLENGKYHKYSSIIPSSSPTIESLTKIENKLKKIKENEVLLDKINEDLKKFESQINNHKDTFSLIEGIGTNKNSKEYSVAVKVLGTRFQMIQKTLAWLNSDGLRTQEQIANNLEAVGQQMGEETTVKGKEMALRKNEIWSVLRLITFDLDTLGGYYGELGMSLSEVENQFLISVSAGGTDTVIKNNGASTVSKVDIILTIITELENKINRKIGVSLKAHPSVSEEKRKGRVSSQLVSSSVQALFADSVGKTKDSLTALERLKILNTLTLNSSMNIKLKNLLAYSHFIQAAAGFKDDTVHIMLDSHKGWMLASDFIDDMLKAGQKNSSPLQLTGKDNTFNKVRERIVNKIKNNEESTLFDISVPLGFKTRNMKYEL